MRFIAVISLLCFLLTSIGAVAAPCPFLTGQKHTNAAPAETAPCHAAAKQEKSAKHAAKNCCCDSVIGCKLPGALPIALQSHQALPASLQYSSKSAYIYSHLYDVGSRPPNSLS